MAAAVLSTELVASVANMLAAAVAAGRADTAASDNASDDTRRTTRRMTLSSCACWIAARRLSRTERLAKTRASWNVRRMPETLIFDGVAPLIRFPPR